MKVERAGGDLKINAYGPDTGSASVGISGDLIKQKGYALVDVENQLASGANLSINVHQGVIGQAKDFKITIIPIK